jgi:hypothetical protein
VNHKILFKKQRALQKEREASTLKSFPCPQQQQQQQKEKRTNRQKGKKKQPRSSKTRENASLTK